MNWNTTTMTAITSSRWTNPPAGMIAPGCLVPFCLKFSGSHSSCLLDFGLAPIQCSPSSPSPARGAADLRDVVLLVQDTDDRGRGRTAARGRAASQTNRDRREGSRTTRRSLMAWTFAFAGWGRWTKVQYQTAGRRRTDRRVGKRFGLVTLVLVLSVISLGFRDKTQTVAAAAPIAGPAIRPLDVVTSSVSRELASLRSQRIGFHAGEERRAEIRGPADELFDVNDMARRALGQHWKGLLPRQHEEFVRLFGDVLARSFVTIVERYTGDNVASLDEEVAGTFAKVRSGITPEQRSEIAIEYRLSQRGSQWTVYDVVVDGVSLVSNYRSQFNSIIAMSFATQ